MKKIRIEQLIPGNDDYDRIQPLRPLNSFSSPSFFLFAFTDKLAILPKGSERLYTSFDEWVAQGILPYSELDSGNFHHPVLYFVEETDLHLLELFFYEENRFFCVEYSSGTAKIIRTITLEDNPLYPKVNSSGTLAYSTDRNELFIIDKGFHVTKLLTVTNNYRIDKTPSRDEFGIHDLFYWSPNGNRLAFYMTDDSQVAEYPIVHLEEPIAKVEMIKYPMAGQDSESTQIGVLDTTTGSLSCINCANDPVLSNASRTICHACSYLPCLSWSDDSQHIFLCELERSQNYFQAKQYSADTGALEALLFEESDKQYVEPEFPFYSIGDSLYFLSQRTGHNHIYRYKTIRKETEQLTSGEWEVNEILCARDNEIIYLASESSPLNREAYRLNLQTGRHDKLSSLTGYQSLFISGNDMVLLNENGYSSITILVNGHSLMINDPINEYELPRQEIGSFKKDGDDIFYRITHPFRTTTQGRSPVVFYVYGGPHVQLITHQRGSSTKGFEEMMALSGYYVFYIDPHGSANRGHAFESSIYQRLNQPQREDYHYALNWFFNHYGTTADPNRIAIYGWSFGGFMTLSMLLTGHGGFPFKIGIAGGAVVDWRYYEVMYTERYMGIRDKDTEHYYDSCDMKQKLQDLRTHLYLIHCDNDPVVLWQNTLSLLQKANKETKNGNLIDYYVYPGHPHNVKGTERLQLMIKIKSLIDKELK